MRYKYRFRHFYWSVRIFRVLSLAGAFYHHCEFFNWAHTTLPVSLCPSMCYCLFLFFFYLLTVLSISRYCSRILILFLHHHIIHSVVIATVAAVFLFFFFFFVISFSRFSFCFTCTLPITFIQFLPPLPIVFTFMCCISAFFNDLMMIFLICCIFSRLDCDCSAAAVIVDLFSVTRSHDYCS